jgi:hypothetical protein
MSCPTGAYAPIRTPCTDPVQLRFVQDHHNARPNSTDDGVSSGLQRLQLPMQLVCRQLNPAGPQGANRTGGLSTPPAKRARTSLLLRDLKYKCRAGRHSRPLALRLVLFSVLRGLGSWRVALWRIHASPTGTVEKASGAATKAFVAARGTSTEPPAKIAKLGHIHAPQQSLATRL